MAYLYSVPTSRLLSNIIAFVWLVFKIVVVLIVFYHLIFVAAIFNLAGFIVPSLCIMSTRCFEDSCGYTVTIWNTDTQKHQRISGC